MSTNNTKYIPDIGHVFRDTEDSYSGTGAFDLHIFNGTDTITTGSTIDVDSTDFSLNDYTLIRFNGKFVSGGYSATYDGTPISPFSNWSNYAVSGPNYYDYRDRGVDNFKWIAINVNSKRGTGNFSNNVDLSTFLISSNNVDYLAPVLVKFGDHNDPNGYEAYISHDGKFGALDRIRGTSSTLWYLESSNSTISDAKNNSGALQPNGTDAYIDSNTTANIYLVVGLPQNGSSSFILT